MTRRLVIAGTLPALCRRFAESAGTLSNRPPIHTRLFKQSAVYHRRGHFCAIYGFRPIAIYPVAGTLPAVCRQFGDVLPAPYRAVAGSPTAVWRQFDGGLATVCQRSRLHTRILRRCRQFAASLAAVWANCRVWDDGTLPAVCTNCRVW